MSGGDGTWESRGEGTKGDEYVAGGNVHEEKDITIEGMDCLEVENIINDDLSSK
jgi:hypothetical protein